MGSSLDKIMKQHRKTTKEGLVYEALAKRRSEQWREDYEKNIVDGVKAVPIEAKRKFIELMREGKNLGTAAKEAGIEDTSIAGRIMIDNMGEYNFLKKPEDVK